MSSARTSLSPAAFIRAGFDWSGRTARLPYIIIAILTLLLVSLIPVTRNFTNANTAVFVALAMLVPVWLGHTRRRLRDVGWTGWLMWIAILPIAGLLLTIFLAFKPAEDGFDAETGGYSKTGLALSLAFGAALLSRAFWAPYWIPASSMKPSLLVGDFVVVVPIATPERGDILVVQHPVRGDEIIARLIGLPEEQVQMVDGRVEINGARLEQDAQSPFLEPFAPQGAHSQRPRCQNTPATDGDDCVKTQRTETLPNGRHYNILDLGVTPGDDTGVFNVPEGAHFLLGDHRDNANDSRFDPELGGLGYVPRENLTGRAAFVLFSSEGQTLWRPWAWRTERYLRRVE